MSFVYNIYIYGAILIRTTLSGGSGDLEGPFLCTWKVFLAVLGDHVLLGIELRAPTCKIYVPLSEQIPRPLDSTFKQ